MLTPTGILLFGLLCLFGVGLFGLMVIRNLIKIVVILQLLTKTAILSLVLAGSMNGQINVGQSIATTVIVVDTIVAVVALALVVQVQKRCGTLDLRDLSTLRR